MRFGALDHTSKTVKLKAEGMLAQALEHEVDHLNGILYIDHLESHEDLFKVEPEDELQDPSTSDGVSPSNAGKSDEDSGTGHGLGTEGSEESGSEDSPASLTVG